ncbi:3-oxoacyl-ACP synthase [Burkholderia sp. Bp9142]|uniref:3-oxoacyl-ACP synthase n=1 Tax=Burkholderia sp. Bp9142 TaxID=2184573 RepID=UPI000F598BC7|nr:3-oxoacyl-ACP synthase [Burkholderia sp. Bp9142]RQR25032.1 3-oxoacyl-ACP synthase [Burkholderia sp. Bp9142]
MNAPVITALASYVPRTVAVYRDCGIEPTHDAPIRSGWHAWVASWQADYAPHPTKKASVTRSAAVNAAADEIRCVPVERDTDLSGLAAKVAQLICAARPADAAPIDIAMLCHSSLNEHVSTTTAGRLRAVIGAPCFPFAVSQQQGASTFTALQLASDLLIAEPEIHTILIVAAEKWCSPFSRWTDQGIVQGDAAGAILVERSGPASCGLVVIDARANRLHRLTTSAPLSNQAIRTDWVRALRSTIDAILLRHALQPNDVGTVVGAGIDPQLDEAICRHLGRSLIEFSDRRRAYLGAAEPIVQLANVFESHDLPVCERILTWGIGLGGFVGCALFESHGRPLVYLNPP